MTKIFKKKEKPNIQMNLFKSMRSIDERKKERKVEYILIEIQLIEKSSKK